MASLRDRLRVMTLTVFMAGASMLVPNAVAGVNVPQLERGKGERCVEDTEYIRRNHMNLLKHHRDKTMRQGIRTTKHSLKGCVECHASEITGSVASSKEDFCMACHVFTGVKLDCWECHATKPASPKPVRSGATASPLMSAVPNGGSQ